MMRIKGNFGKRYVKLTGGQGGVKDTKAMLEKIEKIDDLNKTISQVFDASKIMGRNHLIQATKLALEAIESRYTFANSPKIELSCWTAGLRQINKALKRVGITKQTKNVAIVTVGKGKKQVDDSIERILTELEIIKDEKCLEFNESKKKIMKKTFEIPESKLEVVSPQDAILEEIALLSLKK